MFVETNPNPAGNRVGDCTIRAISIAFNRPWEDTYFGLMAEGYLMHDMPSSNAVWGAFLRRNGFIRRSLPTECPNCYTVSEFARDNSNGTYILALSGHVVCVIDGNWFDTWDSGSEMPLYYWERSGK